MPMFRLTKEQKEAVCLLDTRPFSLRQFAEFKGIRLIEAALLLRPLAIHDCIVLEIEHIRVLNKARLLVLGPNKQEEEEKPSEPRIYRQMQPVGFGVKVEMDKSNARGLLRVFELCGYSCSRISKHTGLGEASLYRFRRGGIREIHESTYNRLVAFFNKKVDTDPVFAARVEEVKKQLGVEDASN